jgi:hypothetical protein
MSKIEDINTALLKRLRALNVTPGVSISMFDIGVPLIAEGFSEEEIMSAVFALEEEERVAFVPGNRLQLLKPLP